MSLEAERIVHFHRAVMNIAYSHDYNSLLPAMFMSICSGLKISRTKLFGKR